MHLGYGIMARGFTSEACWSLCKESNRNHCRNLPEPHRKLTEGISLKHFKSPVRESQKLFRNKLIASLTHFKSMSEALTEAFQKHLSSISVYLRKLWRRCSREEGIPQRTRSPSALLLSYLTP